MIINETNLATVLAHRAEQTPDKHAYSFLEGDNKVYCTYTYQELFQLAQRIAGEILPYTQPNDRVVLIYASESLFLPALLGCFFAGVIAVPTLPPTNKSLIKKLESICHDCQPTVILSEEKIIKKLLRIQAKHEILEDGFLQKIIHAFTDDHEVAKLSHLVGIDTSKLEVVAGVETVLPKIDSNAIAFLQYTSGSTGLPKGVMVKHSNLMSNMQIMIKAYHLGPETNAISWLPVTHDMGLIGTILQMIYMGGHLNLMSPLNFLFKPVRWLQAISDMQLTSSTGPNFAYRFCVERITEEQRDSLDLRSWQVAICGAEPIRPTTMRQFCDYFAPSGFKPNAFYCSYGMAETTLFVSTSEGLSITAFDDAQIHHNHAIVNAAANKQYDMVNCGKPQLSTKIVNPTTHLECNAGEIGEIWVCGDSICAGYWGNEETTRDTFQATIKNDVSQTHYLRTGDLGFLYAGDLFITGRRKETIIINGVNHYPQDIEETVLQANSALQEGTSIAFSVECDQQEQLVVAAELKRGTQADTFESISQDIVADLLRYHQLTVAVVMLLPSGRLPKTTSGKLQRTLCRSEFLRDQMRTMYKDIYILETGTVTT